MNTYLNSVPWPSRTHLTGISPTYPAVSKTIQKFTICFETTPNCWKTNFEWKNHSSLPNKIHLWVHTSIWYIDQIAHNSRVHRQLTRQSRKSFKSWQFVFKHHQNPAKTNLEWTSYSSLPKGFHLSVHSSIRHHRASRTWLPVTSPTYVPGSPKIIQKLTICF